MGLNECRAVLQEAGFGTSISRQENAKPAGTFLGISPRDRAPQFSTIRLLVSSGPAPEPEPAPDPTSDPPSSEPPSEPPPAEPPPAQPGPPTKPPRGRG